MTVVKTMSIRIVDPKAERLIVDLASQNLIEIDEPEVDEEAISALDEFSLIGRDMDAWRKSQGFTEKDEPTMEEIVAICKEARAELYADKQKNTACR
ncbi:MAG: hypothetical protein FWG73_01780 [Planctomycetaceae bacterium]|nr:hypothetical protein [Planctomycetaceae bacterium]